MSAAEVRDRAGVSALHDVVVAAHRSRQVELRAGRRPEVLGVASDVWDRILAIVGSPPPPVFVWATPLPLICRLEVRPDPTLPDGAVQARGWS